MKSNNVAVYKGEDIIFLGTMRQAAKYLRVEISTIKFYLSPAYAKRVASRKTSGKSTTIVLL